jgi:mannose-6-phosphate isomerase-like protein (cupin superfamily)
METNRDYFTSYTDVDAFITKDASTIRELMHPAQHAVRAQSLAEAIVDVGASTHPHLHRTTEEIYHITAGEGMMTRGAERFAIRTGDTIVMAPGTPHWVTNTGNVPLKILCACTPAYRDDDTELLTLSAN